MKIAVLGAGALGTLYGGALARNGEEVWLVHHTPSVAHTLDTNGVCLESETLGSQDRIDVRATADASDVGHADLVLVLTKTHQTRTALSDHAACIGPETRLLTLQNGLGLDRLLAEFVPAERVLAGVTYHGATRQSTNVVEHTNAGTVVFGGPDASFAACVADRLRAAGFADVQAVSDPQPEIWDKQLVSVAFKPTAALTRLPNGELVADEERRALMASLVAEANQVAQTRGVVVPTDDPFDHVLSIGRSNPTHRSSMLEDVEAGRKTEIDAANGAIVTLGDEAGIDVSANRLVTTLVRGLEQSYL